nr:hypothetical protein [Pelagivirga sediminicola]
MTDSIQITHDGLPMVAAIPPIENSTSAGTPDAIQKASFHPIALCRLPDPDSFVALIHLSPLLAFLCIGKAAMWVVCPSGIFYYRALTVFFCVLSIIDRPLGRPSFAKPGDRTCKTWRLRQAENFRQLSCQEILLHVILAFQTRLLLNALMNSY